MCIAHKTEETVQTVKEHCENTAMLAKEMSVEELKDVNYVIALLHDIGKYQPTFQKRINGENIRIEHSNCGAIEAGRLYKNALSYLMQYCIMGHHSGIPDSGSKNENPDMPTLYGRLKRETEDYNEYKYDLVIPEINENEFNQFIMKGCNTRNDIIEKFAFLTRYCFSCLTDADSLDTAEFCNGYHDKSLKADFNKCLARVDEKFNSFVCTTELQKTRAKLQQQVYEKEGINSEIYLMNMPTGSGKTLCSIKFALERAVRSGKKRIIYVIPYNSIIEQTADIFEKMFSDDAQILRHQSTFSYEDKSDYNEDYKQTIKYATENWDAQIIITTAVQFFESVYSNKRGKLRKLHNLAESVLVFDEAHLMPTDYLEPCLRAITYITKYLNSEAVFLTATMPDFKKLVTEYALPDSKIEDLITDICDFGKFKKCEYKILNDVSAEQLICNAKESPASLIVVNKRSTALELYKMCGGKKYHLSTYMTAFDRKNVIEEIRYELNKLYEDYPDYKNVPDERRITVVSTSLIEAGVDLDFYTVFREVSGLDSILQAGGRCNREGKRKNADVYVFELESEKYKKCYDERKEITKGIISEFSDISLQESIKTYYDRLFFIKRDNITSHCISNDSKDIRDIKFKEYSEKFEMIDTNTVSVVVARDERSEKLINELKFAGIAKTRQLQNYSFSVYKCEFEKLSEQHVVDDYGSGVFCLTNPDYYNTETGVVFEGKDIYFE